jgi:anti-sigma B factor antagonist
MSVLEFSVATAELEGNAFVVTVTGEVDMYTAPKLEEALTGVIGLGGTSVVLDLADVSFIDSTVLSILLRYQERIAGLGGQLVIVTDDRRLLRTFEITGVGQLLAIEPRLGDGVASVIARSNGASLGT